jgi:hypothetical protein
MYANEGDLEESMADLEESRRKLAVLQMKKYGTSAFNVPSATSMVNGSILPNKVSESGTNINNKSTDWKELQEAVDDDKVHVHSRILMHLYISLCFFYLSGFVEELVLFWNLIVSISKDLKDNDYIIDFH